MLSGEAAWTKAATNRVPASRFDRGANARDQRAYGLLRAEVQRQPADPDLARPRRILGLDADEDTLRWTDRNGRCCTVSSAGRVDAVGRVIDLGYGLPGRRRRVRPGEKDLVQDRER